MPGAKRLFLPMHPGRGAPGPLSPKQQRRFDVLTDQAALAIERVRLRAALTRTIQEEAERLNRVIGNRLDRTRLEAGLAGLCPGGGAGRTAGHPG